MANTVIDQQAWTELKSKIGNIEINAETIIDVLRFSMEIVETTQLKGVAQKKLALELVRQVVVEAPISDDKEKLLLDMIDKGILGNTVDLIVLASRGGLDINLAAETAVGCISVCFPYCLSLCKKK